MGGDFKYVGEEGTARLKMVEVPLEGMTPGMGLRRVKKMVVNVPLEDGKVDKGEARAVEGMKVRGAKTIVGPYVQYVKGSESAEAIIKAQEGMWEERRGVKVDGGERRKLMVRRNRLLAERKLART